jgi:hypothetical protein
MNREASVMSGQNRKLRDLLDALSAADDRPRIGEYDELLEALRREFGPDGRPDFFQSNPPPQGRLRG